MNVSCMLFWIENLSDTLADLVQIINVLELSAVEAVNEINVFIFVDII